MMKSHALALAEKGFWVFRLRPGGKLPLRKGWQLEATRDPEVLSRLWDEEPNANPGIFTSRYEDDKAIIAVDEDNKDGRDGQGTLFQLDFEGRTFPPTFVQTTVTGGRHHVYSARQAVKQGSNVLGAGLDIRSRGGYLVGSGAVINGKNYQDNDAPLAQAPDWIVAQLAIVVDTKPKAVVDISRINPARATERALEYLATVAPLPSEGSRNETAYRVCCTIKDKGVLQDECLSLMYEWNGMLESPIEDEELETTVRSAYKTGQNDVGAVAAEALFDVMDMPEEKPAATPASDEPILHPFETLSKNYALVMAGGGHHILWETTDVKGNFKLEHLQEASFHKKFAWYTMQTGDGKTHSTTKLWMTERNRCRRYDGLVFAPGRQVDTRFYNMWRGFSFEPPKPDEVFPPEAIRAVELFNEHALQNVSNGDLDMYQYLIKYFAHMVQRPWEKPLVALVFKGEKGVGKNALVQCIGALFKAHTMLTSKKRYLISNFNGHLESLLLFILDEAFWSGDKEAEGVLKDLITGSTHSIERKNQEVYDVDNLTRLVVISNEDWIVPATDDERRYGVYSVNNNRKQDIKFFTEMREGMEAGGYRLLLQQLLNTDLRGFQINKAPQSTGLVQQKIASLDVLGQWWFDVLMHGELFGSTFTGVDFSRISAAVIRSSFQNYAKARQVRSRLPDETTLAKQLKRFAVSMHRVPDGEGNHWYVTEGGLNALRKDFETYVKGKVEWQANEMDCLK